MLRCALVFLLNLFPERGLVRIVASMQALISAGEFGKSASSDVLLLGHDDSSSPVDAISKSSEFSTWTSVILGKPLLDDGVATVIQLHYYLLHSGGCLESLKQRLSLTVVVAMGPSRWEGVRNCPQVDTYCKKENKSRSVNNITHRTTHQRNVSGTMRSICITNHVWRRHE
jgi:hypothetical protein